MNRLPKASKAMPSGFDRLALKAKPPSPAYAAVPFPTTVVMVPLASTLRMRLLHWSSIYRFLDESKVMRGGLHRLALVAAPPSPEYPEIPLPATVVMMPLVVTLRIR